MYKCHSCNIDITSVGNFRAHVITKKHLTNVAKTQEELKQAKKVKKAKQPKIEPQLQPEQPTNQLPSDLGSFVCKCCNKSYYSDYNLRRHRNSCKGVVKILKNSKINIIDDLNLLAQGGVADKQITIIINANNINTGTVNNTNNINNGTINNTINTVPAEDPIKKEMCKAVDKIIYDSCKDPNLYVSFENHWKQQKVLPLGYETDEHITNHKNIWGNGRQSYMKYLEDLYSNPLNQNIYRTDERNKTMKFICANGQIKEMDIEKLLDIQTLNNFDRYNNYIKRTANLVEDQYKKVVMQMQKEQDLCEDSIPNFDGLVKDTKTVLQNYSKGSKKNIQEYEKSNPAIIHGPIPGMVLPSTSMRIEF
jgi:hypothetical protein